MQASPYSRIDPLTSFRFFAAAMIVYGHGASRFGYTFGFFDLRQGVTFFFVLSGFILSHAYANARWREDWPKFIVARFARIWPAHATTALFALATVATIQSTNDALKSLVNLTLLQAFIPYKDWHYSLNGVSWSISAEMFFYVLLPFAIVMRSRAIACVGLALIAAALWIASASSLSPIEADDGITAWAALYISPFARLPEFLCGVLAYRAYRRGPWQNNRFGASRTAIEASALLMCVSIMILATSAADALSDSMPQVAVWLRVSGPFPAFALLLMVFAVQGGAVSRTLNARLLVYLGEVSFALYLVHQLVIRNMFAWAWPWVEANPAIAYMSYWGISLMCAVALHEFVEKPARTNLLRRFSNRLHQRIAQAAAPR